MPMPSKKIPSEKQTHEHSLDVLVTPLFNSFDTVAAIKKIPKENLEDIYKKIKNTNEKIASGNTHHLEDMLLNQVHVLEAIFYSCTHRMLAGEYLNQVKVYSNIALKAQKQCRNTVMAITELKNPKQTTFVKQQNNAINQQINLENKSTQANELLEKQNDTVDTRTPFTASAAYPQLETVGEINRR